MLCRTRWSCFTTLLLSCALAAQSQHTTKPNFTQDDTVERQDFPTASVSCATTNFLLHSFDVRNLNESLGQVAHTTEPVRVVNFCVSFLEKVRLSPPDQSMKQDHRPRHTAEMERQLRQHVFPNCSTTTQQPSANGLSVTVTYPGSGRHADLFTPYATVPPNCVDRISNFRMSQQGLFLVSVVQRVSLEANEFADLSCNVSTPKGVSWTQRMPEAHESNRSVAWFLQNCSDTAAVDSHANMSEGSALCPPILLTQLHSSATTLSKAAERWQHVYDFRQAQKSEQKVLKKQRRRLLSARSSAQQVKARDGLENGTALKNIYTDEVHEAALGLHQHFGFTSFLSEGDTVAGSDAIKMILDPVIHGVMNPVIQIVVGEISDRFMEVMGDQLREILEQNVPPNAALMLASTMIPSVTNALLDSVTARLSRSLSESLAVDLGTSLEYGTFYPSPRYAIWFLRMNKLQHLCCASQGFSFKLIDRQPTP
eukprot:INCI15776.3.p1 GENE.INCI15776.3~~INCI15776.3.p1  ORF type:complete len:482 (-),score=56.28 INCI15776.3:1014-2459(-)